jgi:predicted RNA polymerase sigma factor
MRCLFASYESALDLATQEPERRLISKRLEELRLTSPR